VLHFTHVHMYVLEVLARRLAELFPAFQSKVYMHGPLRGDLLFCFQLL